MRKWVIQHVITGQFLRVSPEAKPEWWPDGTYRPRGEWVDEVNEGSRFSEADSERLTSPPVSMWVPHDEAVAQQMLAKAS